MFALFTRKTGLCRITKLARKQNHAKVLKLFNSRRCYTPVRCYLTVNQSVTHQKKHAEDIKL